MSKHFRRTNLVSGPCGSGKTFAVLHDIANHISSDPPHTAWNYLYLTATKTLADQVASDLKNFCNSSATVITEDTHKGHVVKAIMNHLKTSAGMLVCTHSAFLRLPFFPKNRR